MEHAAPQREVLLSESEILTASFRALETKPLSDVSRLLRENCLCQHLLLRLLKANAPMLSSALSWSLSQRFARSTGSSCNTWCWKIRSLLFQTACERPHRREDGTAGADAVGPIRASWAMRNRIKATLLLRGSRCPTRLLLI